MARVPPRCGPFSWAPGPCPRLPSAAAQTTCSQLHGPAGPRARPRWTPPSEHLLGTSGRAELTPPARPPRPASPASSGVAGRAPAGLRPQDCSRRPVSVPRPAHRPSVFTPPPDSRPDLSLLSGPPSPLPETNAPESRWPPRPPVLSSSLCPSLSQGDLSKAETQGHASARPSCSKASLRFRDGGHDP